MKRFTLLMLVVGIAFSVHLVGCTKKEKVEKPVEETVTEKKVEAPKEVPKKVKAPKEAEPAKKTEETKSEAK